MKYKLPIEIESLDDDRFLAKCLFIQVQGCHAEGSTIPEAIDNLEDIARQLLELRIEDGFPLLKELLEYREDVKEVLKAETVLAIP